MPNDPSILQRNLASLARTEPALAEELAGITPAALTWTEAKTGDLTATVNHDGRPLALASKYDPQQEAARLVDHIDHATTPCVVVLGLGLGYHIDQIARAMSEQAVLIVFEPDLALLRAVLEHIDHSAWLGRSRLVLAGPDCTRAKLIGRLSEYSGLITQGMTLLEHPPTRKRCSDSFKPFAKLATEALAFCRTNVATALVNSARTCRNLACNLDYYVAGATTNQLHQAAANFPAVCVSAGPSLVKNVDLLQNPDIRKNVVVIAVQTALKPLLDRGIRPDFVTALDYSSICKRFYEDLPPLQDVTLVVEPKAHPTILESFPGPIRITQSQFNDQFLGEFARPITPLPSGATVAHLSFYLAQHLGCDPIIFIGQDLGFSDGLYYAPGTAVHQVWSSELNPFNTIEMMEWRRIVRMRGHLQRAEDIHGKPIFTDEQMLTYLKQFERDFTEAKQTIIDATEGGMPKEGAVTLPLAEALEQHATRPVPDLPIPHVEPNRDRLEMLVKLLARRIEEIQDLRQATQRTITILKQMLKHQKNKAKMDKLFTQLQKQQRHVEGELRDVFNTVNMLNTIGAFRRNRADHAISQIRDDEVGRQLQQLDRDLENLDWLIQASDEALSIFREAETRAAASLDRVTAMQSREKRSRSSTIPSISIAPAGAVATR